MVKYIKKIDLILSTNIISWPRIAETLPVLFRISRPGEVDANMHLLHTHEMSQAYIFFFLFRPLSAIQFEK